MVQLNWHGTCDEWDEIKEAIKKRKEQEESMNIDPSEAYKTYINKLHDIENDPVKHPSHYTEGKYECIDYIQARGYGFELGNAVKYITRAGKKSPEKKIEDLRKAIQYLDFYKDPNIEWIGLIDYSNDKYLPGLLASALMHIDKAHDSRDPASREAFTEMAKDCIEAYISRISNSDYDKEMVGNRTE